MTASDIQRSLDLKASDIPPIPSYETNQLAPIGSLHSQQGSFMDDLKPKGSPPLAHSMNWSSSLSVNSMSNADETAVDDVIVNNEVVENIYESEEEYNEGDTKKKRLEREVQPEDRRKIWGKNGRRRKFWGKKSRRRKNWATKGRRRRRTTTQTEAEKEP